MHRKVASTLVVLALAFAGIAGCGGGDEPLTRAEFVKQANAACVVKQQRTSTTERTRGPAGFLTQIVAQQQEILDGLEDLDAPDQLDNSFNALKKAMQERVDIVEKALAAVKEDPKTKLETFGTQAEVPQKAISRSSKALGLKNCT